ncbi:MAG: hypothetical protein JNM30_05600 [Rhodospirillales bacterium]|nr:hypothetical protein [Rhodospirillales bacterium]
MPRISFALSVGLLTLCLAGGMSGTARADEDRRAYATSQPASPYPPVEPLAAAQPQSRPDPGAKASRLHPEACASLCRMFEFLGALERPAPPKPIPTS